MSMVPFLINLIHCHVCIIPLQAVLTEYHQTSLDYFSPYFNSKRNPDAFLLHGLSIPEDLNDDGGHTEAKVMSGGLKMKDMHFDTGQCCNTADTIGQLQTSCCSYIRPWKYMKNKLLYLGGQSCSHFPVVLYCDYSSHFSFYLWNYTINTLNNVESGHLLLL